MKVLLGSDIGSTVFAPGVSGTITVASCPDFSPARVMAVTNVTRGVLLYYAEAANGSWSSVTGSGGVLTLSVDTSGQSSADVLRVIYEQHQVSSSSRNILSVLPDAWNVSTGSASIATAERGPFPWMSAYRFTLAGSNNQGIATGQAIRGRTAGNFIVLSFWAKGSGPLNVAVTASGSSEQHVEFTFPGLGDLTGAWAFKSAALPVGDLNIDNTTVRIYGANDTATDIYIAGVQLEHSPTDTAQDYTTPTGRGTDVPLFLDSGRKSIATWGDSRTAGANGYDYPSLLSRELAGYNGGYVVFNGGVGGETSTQIKTRMLAGVAKNNYDVVILWAGRNNFNDPTTVLADIDAMVSALPHGRFLVLSIPNATDEATGSSANTAINSLNSTLSARFGTRYLDVKSLFNAGSTDDTPRALYMSDTIHPNWVGHGLEVEAIISAMKSHGWV